MLRFKWLELEAIGLFVDKQRIDFTKLGDLVQVDGLNKNTNGSSGAAKTTVFNAVDFLFGLNDKPATVLQSRLTKESMKVTGCLDWDGKELIISRGKKLSITVDGEVTVGSNKLAEEQLDAIIGMSRDIFRKMLHKRQKEGGFFLALGPSDTYKFLVDCTGLTGESKKVEKLELKIKDLTTNSIAALNDLERATSALNATKAALQALGAVPKPEVDQATVLDLKRKYDAVAAQFNGVQANHKEALNALEAQRPQLAMSTFDSSPRTTFERELAEVRKSSSKLIDDEGTRVASVIAQTNDLKIEASQLRHEIASGKVAKIEASRVAQDIKKIRDSICPTCEQNWVTQAAKAKEDSLMAQIGHLKGILEKANKAEQRLSDVMAQIDGLKSAAEPKIPSGLHELHERENELSNHITQSRAAENDLKNADHYLNQVKLKAFADQQKEITAIQVVEIDQIRGQLEISRRNLEGAVFSLKSFDQAKSKYDTTAKMLMVQEEKYTSDLQEAAKLQKQYKHELLLAEESKRAIKSYVSCSFEDALSAIGDKATQIIRNLPNMANATIRLEGTRETKEGKIKEEVTAVLDNEGEEGVDLRSLCGGEESSTDLAIDLAVIDFVEHKANKGINLFILDEPFTGMDTVIIEQALEVLKNANISKCLILVDHNETVKEMVDSRIVVVRTGISSQIQQ